MIRYLEALFRHPIVILTPLVLAIVVSVAYPMAQPREYVASTTVWFSTSQPSDVTGAVVFPDTSTGAKALAVFQEFLKSRSFDLQVGKDGKLADYYAPNPTATAGLTGMLHRAAAKVGLASKPGPLTGGALDDQVAAAVAADVVVTAPGPQLVQITVTGPSADSVAATALATYNTFSEQVIQARSGVLANDVRYYTASVADAKQSVTTASTNLADYQAHRATLKTDPTGASDPTQVGLDNAVTQAQQRYQTAIDHLNQSQLSFDTVVGNAGFHVVDPSQVPGGPVSVTRHLVLSVLGGVVIGLLVMLTILVMITSADRTLRSSDDVRRSLGVRAGASIARLKKLSAQEA